MKIYKFGGSVLATSASREVAINLLSNLEHEKYVVICSAMGRNGFPYATDTLKKMVKENTLLENEMARLLSVGEILSSLLFTSDCRSHHINAIWVSPKQFGILTDDNFLNASLKRIDIHYLQEMLKEYQVVVVPGFIGVEENDEITLLGRGGSDLSAVAIANALKEKEVYLWKDVDGIYPSYPLIGKNMVPYTDLSYEEMKLLIELGYNVIQDNAIFYAQKEKIKIHLRHYLHQDKGTDIEEESSSKECIGLFSSNHEIRLATFYPDLVLSKVQEELKKQHIFLKDYQIMNNQVIISLPSSQISVARKQILNLYWPHDKK